MRMYDIIQKKRDGGELSEQEICFFVEGYTKGEIPDYQISALCMAIYFQGMSDKETAALTFAIRDSGAQLDCSHIDGIRVDKHSTGGVGDKTSLIVVPIVASLGLKVVKMSGRGLGYTGGTIDKLESIPNLRTNLSLEEIETVVNQAGFAIVSQTSELAPADKLLYALRDVTATVDSIPLIASSIMGKKLTTNDDCIVLDVKTGKGAFMKRLEKSRELARLMVKIGNSAGKKICAMITNMDAPLGYAVGNSLEVIEAIETLKGNGPEDLRELCLALAAQMLFLANKGDLEFCRQSAQDALDSGAAYDCFAKMVAAQGGDVECLQNTACLPTAKYHLDMISQMDGYLYEMNADEYGLASLLLGAGRSNKGDSIDAAAGLILHKKPGDAIKAGESFVTLYTNNEERLAEAERVIFEATALTETKIGTRPLIFDTITS